MNSHQVDVPDLPIRTRAPCHETQEKPDRLILLFGDSGEIAKLVKEDGVSQRTGRSPPPAVDDLHDVVVVVLFEEARFHTATRVQ